jgi:small subunit ribosomal protein S17
MTDEQAMEQTIDPPQTGDAPASDVPQARRARIGQVISAAHNKTCRVQVDHLAKHPMYNKYVRRSTKLLVHDELGQAGVGDTVEIVPCRRLSKHKAHRLVKILRRSEAK